MNASEKAKGEPWTRVDPVTKKKSVLDLVVISEDLLKYVEDFYIDTARQITPFKPESDGSMSYTDHNAIAIVFKGIPKKSSNVNSANKYQQDQRSQKMAQP